ILKRQRPDSRTRTPPKTEPHRMNAPLGSADNRSHIPNCRIDGVLQRQVFPLGSPEHSIAQTIQSPREAAQDGASGHHPVFAQERKTGMPRIRISWFWE